MPVQILALLLLPSCTTWGWFSACLACKSRGVRHNLREQEGQGAQCLVRGHTNRCYLMTLPGLFTAAGNGVTRSEG